MDTKDLEEKIGYQFKDSQLLLTALTHSSYANEYANSEACECNERMEFLGDAVLEVISSEFLYNKYTNMPEGDLSKLRASIVCEPTLASIAKELGLGGFLRLGTGEDKTGGRNRASVTSDALEALIGGIFLDGGMECAKKFVHRFILTDIENKKLYHDSKTVLQEILQEKGLGLPIYEIVGEKGPDHAKSYVAIVRTGDKILGSGEAGSKKHAQQEAAYKALVALDKVKETNII
ncbi:MAG: ribonuclease III [Lachnospiraceae bacterium]|nr:ribonuclease III [Lachnospiraceae bacterium]